MIIIIKHRHILHSAALFFYIYIFCVFLCVFVCFCVFVCVREISPETYAIGEPPSVASFVDFCLPKDCTSMFQLISSSY